MTLSPVVQGTKCGIIDTGVYDVSLAWADGVDSMWFLVKYCMGNTVAVRTVEILSGASTSCS